MNVHKEKSRPLVRVIVLHKKHARKLGQVN